MIYESVNIPLWRALRGLKDRRILDVGCGTGALGELLAKNGNTVDGITYSPDEAAIAKDRIASVTVLDLNQFNGQHPALRAPYDVLLFADVLEHLLDPLATLRAFLPHLKEGGKVYVSLPNIACFYVRAGLLFGRFNMSKTGGVLDETHLHHYTLKTAKEMLAEGGLVVEKLDFIPAPSVWFYQTFVKKNPASVVRDPGSGIRDPKQPSSSSPDPGSRIPGPEVPARPEKMADRSSFQFYERRVYPIEHFFTSFWKSLLANQFVFVCERKKS